MKTINIEEIKKEIEKELLKIFNDKLKRIFLYGSYARGDFHIESDIDFIGIVNMPIVEIEANENLMIDLEVKLSLKYDKYISILIRSSENFYKYSESLEYYKNIINEGIVLYEARN